MIEELLKQIECMGILPVIKLNDAKVVQMAHDLLLEGKAAVVTSDRNHIQYLDF